MVPEEDDKVEKYIGGLLDSIQGNVIVVEPVRFQDAICIANNLMDQKLKGYAIKNAENKRRFDSPCYLVLYLVTLDVANFRLLGFSLYLFLDLYVIFEHLMNLQPRLISFRHLGFATALVVIITGASQSRQLDTLAEASTWT
ncbi:hypothetical protein Tco_1483694 [Tanacetum coccineum]